MLAGRMTLKAVSRRPSQEFARGGILFTPSPLEIGALHLEPPLCLESSTRVRCCSGQNNVVCKTPLERRLTEPSAALFKHAREERRTMDPSRSA